MSKSSNQIKLPKNIQNAIKKQKKLNEQNKKLNKPAEVELFVKDSKFDDLTYNQWYKIVQYVINYDIILSNLERLDMMLERQKQLKTFLDCQGIIPEQYKPILNELNKKYNEMLQIQKELEFNNSELTQRVEDQNLIDKINNELKDQMVNKDNLKFAKDHVLYFRNPYFLDSENQHFNERYKALKVEYKNINTSIRQLKPYRKKYLKNLQMFEEQVQRALFKKDFNFKSIFYFVRPFIPKIIESDDYYFSELQALSMLD